MNEILLVVSVVVCFGAQLLAYRAFGRAGLYVTSALAMVCANIEVALLVDGFGVEQTLGNVMFASTFLATDILSECEGKAAAKHAVTLGLFACAFFLVVSRMWLLYIPSANDVAAGGFAVVFGNTPRIIVASFAVYAISQYLDVWLYHTWWAITRRRTGNARALLAVRNIGSTLISQLVNVVAFNLLAFWGTYDASTLVSICVASFAIYAILSVLDTPCVYLARKMHEKRPD